jgi:hypothetical protein
MKKLAAFTLFLGVSVFTYTLAAADFWQAKLFTDWSDKEVQKVKENSPWAKQIQVAMGGGEGTPDAGGKRKGGGSGGAMPNDLAPGAAEGAAGAGMGMTFTIRWQSALPEKQALVRQRFGAEAGTSAEAKQILGNPEPDYVIVVEGLSRGMVRGDADEIKKTLMEATALVIKGKEPIKPKDFRVAGQGKVTAVFAFPRTNPITEDDKEVEFQCKVGGVNLRQRFRLKDMLFNGKLEL